MRTRVRSSVPSCGVCSSRPAWYANRLPVCEPCFEHASTVEKFEYWRALENAIAQPDVQAARRAAAARLVRSIRNGGRS